MNKKISGVQYFLSFWFPVLFYSGIIFYVSSLPGVKTSVSGIHFDKALHFGEYIPFGFLLARAFGQKAGHLSGKNILLWVGGISFLYGLSDEYHQSFVMGRNAAMTDVWADFIGGGLGGFMYSSINTKFKK